MSKEDWLRYRHVMGFGSSEAGALLDIPGSYGSSLQLYLEKIGEKEPFSGNIDSRMGHFSEPHILELAQYVDLDLIGASVDEQSEACMLNWENRDSQRMILKPDAYYQHPELPIFSSPDGIDLGEGEISHDELAQGYLPTSFTQPKIIWEAKNTTGMAQRGFVYGIAPDYRAQVQQTLLITGAKVAYIIARLDGRRIQVHKEVPDPEVHQIILDKSQWLWDKVLEGRRIKKEYDITSYYTTSLHRFPKKQLEGMALLQQLEPEPDSEAEDYTFVKEMIKPVPDAITRAGTEEEYELLMKYCSANNAASNLKAAGDSARAKLLLSMGEDVRELDFEAITGVKGSFKVKGNRPYVSPPLRQYILDSIISNLTK